MHTCILTAALCSLQLWKAVGLVPRQLDALPEQCTPRGSDARAPLLPPSAGGTFGVGSGSRRLQSGRTFSSDLSFGSASTAGCVSLRMASSDINPKSLKVGPTALPVGAPAPKLTLRTASVSPLRLRIVAAAGGVKV